MEFVLMLLAAGVLAWIGAGWLDDYEERLLDEPDGRASGKRTEEREISES